MPTRGNILMQYAAKSPRGPRSNIVMNKIALASLFKEPTGYYRRKTRSNKGVARPTRTKPNSKRQKTMKLQAIAHELGFKRVPRKGTMARAEINRLL